MHFLGYFAWQRLVVQERAEQLDKLSQQQARKLSVNLGNGWMPRRKGGVFAQNAELAASLSRHDDLAFERISPRHSNQLPKAEDIRLIPVGEAQLDQKCQNPHQLLELQLIKAAEQRQPQKLKQ